MYHACTYIVSRRVLHILCITSLSTHIALTLRIIVTHLSILHFSFLSSQFSIIAMTTPSLWSPRSQASAKSLSGSKRSAIVSEVEPVDPTKCRLCSRAGVVKVKGRVECLIHYCCSKDSLRPKENKPEVVDEETLENQFNTSVKDLWSEAVGDVVMMMYEYQKDEQKMNRTDTFGFLNLDSHMLNTSLIGTEKKVKEGMKSDTGTSSKVSDLDRPIWKLGSSGEDSSEKDVVVGREISDGLVNWNDKCVYCKSESTVRRFRSGGYDVAKKETWGGGLAPLVVYEVICRSCNHVEVRNE